MPIPLVAKTYILIDRAIYRYIYEKYIGYFIKILPTPINDSDNLRYEDKKCFSFPPDDNIILEKIEAFTKINEKAKTFMHNCKYDTNILEDDYCDDNHISTEIMSYVKQECNRIIPLLLHRKISFMMYVYNKTILADLPRVYNGSDFTSLYQALDTEQDKTDIHRIVAETRRKYFE